MKYEPGYLELPEDLRREERELESMGFDRNQIREIMYDRYEPKRVEGECNV